MLNTPKKIALIYDFDKTLSVSDMQDYGLIPALGLKPKDFWPFANQWSVDHEADQVTGSMYYFTKIAKEKKVVLTQKLFNECGKNIEYFNGVEEWFKRINEYGKKLGMDIEHYIISAGYAEILEGCSIIKNFKDTFACSYGYDEKGEAVWPARVVNYSIKIQCLSKINKGLTQLDDRAVNEFTPDSDRPIPFRRMIYFGDGVTDIPSMKMVKERGGNSIAVYKPRSKVKETAMKLLKDRRVDFALPADYSEGTELDKTVKVILDKMAKEYELEILKQKELKKIEK